MQWLSSLEAETLGLRTTAVSPSLWSVKRMKAISKSAGSRKPRRDNEVQEVSIS